jgi:hypothetical protein
MDKELEKSSLLETKPNSCVFRDIEGNIFSVFVEDGLAVLNPLNITPDEFEKKCKDFNVDIVDELACVRWFNVYFKDGRRCRKGEFLRRGDYYGQRTRIHTTDNQEPGRPGTSGQLSYR